MCRILVADVAGKSRDLLVEALSLDGHETRLADSGSEVLTRIAEGSVDVLIAEVHLKDRPAWALFPDVHRLDPGIPVIAVSADDSWETSRRVRTEAGPIFFYGLRPLDLDEMRQVVLAAQKWRQRRSGS